jgi:hypothetical protein
MNFFAEGPPCNCCSLVPCRCQQDEPPINLPCNSMPRPDRTEPDGKRQKFMQVVNGIGLEPYNEEKCTNCSGLCAFNGKYLCLGCKKAICKTCQFRKPCCYKCYRDTLASSSTEGYKDAKRKNNDQEALWLHASEPSRKNMYSKFMPNCRFCQSSQLHFCQFCGARRTKVVLKQDLLLS